MFGAPGSDPTGLVSLGLFFNGNNSTPGLVGVSGTNGPGTGVVTASTSNSVSLSFGSATNPQSLSFVDGATTVKLTSFAWNSESLTEDRVSAFNNEPGGSPDLFGSFTVEVSPTLQPVPEPATLLLVGSTLAGAGLAGWRRRNTSRAS
ncbi:MAG TPA: PEP-CTERM sorting domain-containing protein [Methylomirabilota bacterium]|nr:PEP-CTERM sorting domain-containing protein [Methylomirabilota bacterium]